MQNKTKTDSIIYAKGADLADLALKREYEFVSSRFLSPAEQVIYYTAVKDKSHTLASRCFFYGGALAADRRVCVIAPSFADVSEACSQSVFSNERELAFVNLRNAYAPDETLGIVPLEVKGSGFAAFSHRHYMGSILSLGIEREVMGDIAITTPSSAIIFVTESIAPFICDNLTKIGRDGVKVTNASIEKDFTVPRSFSSMTIVAASDRVDSIVASITGMSRNEAKEYCHSDQVEINYTVVTQADERLSTGDIISIRGYGKYIIDSFNGETRSGRARVSVRKYT